MIPGCVNLVTDPVRSHESGNDEEVLTTSGTYSWSFVTYIFHSGQLTRSFNFMFRYIDDVLSLNNTRFCDFVDRIYPIELEIKDTTDTDMW
jgi:hypothetical protein